MSESENIDDELLSAYLDDELAPEERARVEQRLATDPAARQLLEQLRAVSHAVKELPTEPIGADIRDTVLRRAERAMLLSNPTTSTATAGGDSLADIAPRLTIGRSIRGWVWAGLATAAGLAIVAFESSSNRDARLPDTVARREVEAVDGTSPAPQAGDVAMERKQDAPAEPASPAPQAIVAAPPASAPSVDALTASKPSAQGGEDHYAESSASGTTVAARREFGSESRAGGRGGAAEGTTDVDLLVVHVDVKPEAYQQRAFDRVLARNGITIEDSANDENKPPSSKSELAKDAIPTHSAGAAAPMNAPASQSGQTAAGRVERLLSDTSTATENTDLVLVEAPAAQIQSCLEELRRDDRDYTGVAVDEEQSAARQPVNENLRDGSEANKNWMRYNRGIVSRQQKLQRSADNSWYYSTEQGQVTLNRGANRGTNQGIDAQQTEQLGSQLGSGDKSATNLSGERGRAMRMRSQVPALAEQQNAGGNARGLRLDSAGSSTSSTGLNFGFAGHDAKEAPREKAGSASDDAVQVLFVLRPGEAQAATPPADAKASKQ